MKLYLSGFIQFLDSKELALNKHQKVFHLKSGILHIHICSRGLLVLFLAWSLTTGPWTGLLTAAAWEEAQYLAPAITTAILYLSSLALSQRPGSR